VICPKCGHADDPADVERLRSILEEFERRKRRQETNYAIYIGLVIGLTAAGVALAIVMWGWNLWDPLWNLFSSPRPGVVPASVPLWLTILACSLAIACVVLGVLLVGAKRWWPTEIQCPACEYNFGPLDKDPNFCPSCSIALRSGKLPSR
jgi:hypothetical protein